MNVRILLVALGVGLTTGLLSVVVVTETLPFEFSAIVGLPAGLLVAFGFAVSVRRRYDNTSPFVRALSDGTAGFGYAVVVVLGIVYVDLAGKGSTFDLRGLLAVAVAAAFVTAIGSWLAVQLSSGR